VTQTAAAWILCLKRLLYHPDGLTGALTVDELEAAQLEIVKVVQRDAFSCEISLLQSTTSRKKWFPGSLRKLNPMLDNGVVRVGGRLNMSSMTFSQRHPIILPSDHHVTQLINEDYHRKVGHCGMASKWTSLRQSFWIVRGAITVRKVLGKCIICQRWNSCPGSQILSDLPISDWRLINLHFITLESIFWCLCSAPGAKLREKVWVHIHMHDIQSVHLEVAHALTVDSFLKTFRRFVSHRRKVQTLFSDNGTNFVGAEKELQCTLCKWNTNFLAEQLCQRGVWWQFHHPLASDMGGVWERLIALLRKFLMLYCYSRESLTSVCPPSWRKLSTYWIPDHSWSWRSGTVDP